MRGGGEKAMKDEFTGHVYSQIELTLHLHSPVVLPFAWGRTIVEPTGDKYTINRKIVVGQGLPCKQPWSILN